MGLYIRFFKNGVYRAFMYGGKPCKSCRFRCFVDIGCQFGIGPCFSCISKINRFWQARLTIHAFSSSVISAFLPRPGASKRAFSMPPSLYFLRQSITNLMTSPAVYAKLLIDYRIILFQSIPDCDCRLITCLQTGHAAGAHVFLANSFHALTPPPQYMAGA